MQLNEITNHAATYLANTGRKSDTALPNLFVMRKEEVSALEAVVYNPVICLILQGAKETTIGRQSVKLRAGDALLVSHDLPVVSKITLASPDIPYLALILSIDLGIIRSLYEQVGETVIEVPNAQSLSAGPADPHGLNRLAAISRWRKTRWGRRCLALRLYAKFIFVC